MVIRFGKLVAAAVLLAIAVTGVYNISSFAAEAGTVADSMTLTPVKGREELKPGQKFDGSFTIKNTGYDAFDFRAYVKPFSIGVDCTDRYETDNEWTLMSRWVNLEKNNYYDVQPGETITVKFNIDVPINAPSGGQYVVIFAESGDFNPESGTAIGVNKRLGYKFYADLGGEDIRAGNVESVTQQQIYTKPPISSVSTVRNTGNVDFAAKHTYTVAGLDGKEIYSGNQEVDILPDSCRAINAEWPNTPELGLFNVTNKIEYLDGTQYSETKLVLIFPIYLLIIFGLVVILLVVALILKIKNHKAKTQAA